MEPEYPSKLEKEELGDSRARWTYTSLACLLFGFTAIKLGLGDGLFYWTGVPGLVFTGFAVLGWVGRHKLKKKQSDGV